MADTEKLSERRRWLLVVMGISFLIWQAADLEFAERAEGAWQGLFLITGLIASLILFTALILLFLNFRKRGMEKPVREILQDELVKANRRSAFAFGYAAVMLMAVTMFIASIFTGIAAKDAVNIVIIAGIVTPMFAFAWLEGRGG